MKSKAMVAVIGVLAAISLVLYVPSAFLIIVLGDESSSSASAATTSGASGQALADVAMEEYENKQGYDDGLKYTSYFHCAAGTAWCGLFVAYCADQCGYISDGTIGKYSIAYDYYTEASSYGAETHVFTEIVSGADSYTPGAGDLMVRDGHVRIVYSCDGETLETIGGNESDTIVYTDDKSLSDWASDASSHGYTYYIVHPNYTDGDGETVEIPETHVSINDGKTYDVGTYCTREGVFGNFTWSTSSNQYRVCQAWIEAGKETDSQGFNKFGDKYCIACTTTFGDAGDWITWYFDDGTTLETIMCDAKSSGDSTCCTYGHANCQNVLEFFGEKSIGDSPGYTLGIDGKQLVRAVNHGNVY